MAFSLHEARRIYYKYDSKPKGFVAQAYRAGNLGATAYGVASDVTQGVTSVGSAVAHLNPVTVVPAVAVGLVYHGRAVYSTYKHVSALEELLKDIKAAPLGEDGLRRGTQEALEFTISQKNGKMWKRGFSMCPGISLLVTLYGGLRKVYKYYKGTLGAERDINAYILAYNCSTGDLYALAIVVELLGLSRTEVHFEELTDKHGRLFGNEDWIDSVEGEQFRGAIAEKLKSK